MAETTAVPNSYADPYWSQLAATTSDKLGLPPGLLGAIVSRGERTNADQVSSAGAKTPFQIIPATRDAALDKYGIDAYLSPQNAAEVAGLLLKDSLSRNQGNIPQAVAEYHGGTDPANWGAKTQAYVQRVTGAPLPTPAPSPAAPGFQSTFDRIMAQRQEQQATNSVANIYAAYQSGQMSPDERAQFEQDVQGGKIMLPQGASLAPSGDAAGQQAAAGGTVPAGVLQAFVRGQMSPQDMADFESDVRAGKLSLPHGVDANTLFGAPDQPQGVLDKLSRIPSALHEAITGDQRRVASTEALPDWSSMPELNQLSGAGLKTGLGTMTTGPAESAQIIKANFPGVQVTQDEKGNPILTSSIDGKQYAIKPGFRGLDDVVRAGGGIGALLLANEVMPGSGVRGLLPNVAREAAVGGAGEATLQGTQAATGGNFDVGDVGTSAVMGGLAPVISQGVKAAVTPAKALIDRVRGVAPPATPLAVAGEDAGAAAAPAATPPTVTNAPAQPLVAPTVQDIAQTARAAAGGSKAATQDLATMAAPDAKVTDAAQRLGIQDYLQPDHVTSSDAYRQVLGVLKSNPTSSLALSEKEGLAGVAKRATDLIDEIGGTNDVSGLNASVKAKLSATHADASAAEDALWSKLRTAIPAKSEAPANSAVAFAQQRAEELGGAQNLSPMERQILGKLAPQPGADAEMLQALSPTARQQAISQGAGAVKQPTYALLDDVRKDVGAAARQAGPFSDADTGLAKKYYSLLTADQEAAAKAAGAGDLAQQAKAATQVRKGLEDDMIALFGKKLDQSMAPDLSNAMRAAGQGDPSGLVNLLKATPADMRPQVVATGLGTVFRNAATRGDISFNNFGKWWGNLERNRNAYNAVMSSLDPAAQRQISDLATVSRAIDASMQARIKTGLRSTVMDELNVPETLSARLFDVAKHAGKGLAADAVGGHGAGMAMGLFSALKGGAKPSAIKQLDAVLTSPEFLDLARKAGTPAQVQAAKKLAVSKAFGRFAAAIGKTPALSNRERFIVNALQGAHATNGGRDARHPSTVSPVL